MLYHDSAHYYKTAPAGSNSTNNYTLCCLYACFLVKCRL